MRIPVNPHSTKMKAFANPAIVIFGISRVFLAAVAEKDLFLGYLVEKSLKE